MPPKSAQPAAVKKISYSGQIKGEHEGEQESPPPAGERTLTLPVTDVARGELNVVESTDEYVSRRPMHVLTANPAIKPGLCR